MNLQLFTGFIALYELANYLYPLDPRKSTRVFSIIFCTHIIKVALSALRYDDYGDSFANGLSLGHYYCAVDSYLVLSNYKKFKGTVTEILFHHLVFYFTLNPEFRQYLAFGLLCEGSTILLNIGYFMIKAGYHKGLCFQILSVFIWILFLVFRVISFPLITYYSPISIKRKLPIIPVIALNYAWFWKITKKLIEQYRGQEIDYN